jgi:lysophospholipase L1-like esterase
MKPEYPGIPYQLRPNSVGAQDFGSNPDGYFDDDFTLTYRINSLGFRGAETTWKKPDNTVRVVVIGDSFTFGSGVRNEHTFPSAMQAYFSEDKSRQNIEVLNLGAGRYNTVNEVSLLFNKGVRLDPDIVLICFFLNDTNAGGTAKAFSAWVPENQLPLWRRYSRLADIMATRFERQRASEALVKKYIDSFRGDAPGWIQSRKALDSARKLSEERGFKLVLAIYPVLWSLSDDYPFADIHETISNYASGLGLPVLDLQPVFKGYSGPELWAHPNNQHPNAEAHRLAGRAISEYLLSLYPDILSRR